MPAASHNSVTGDRCLADVRLILPFLFGVAIVQGACRHQASKRPEQQAVNPARTATVSATSTVSGTAIAGETQLDAVYRSPSGLYTIRYNHSWRAQQVSSLSGPLDYFLLPNAKLSIGAAPLPHGTTLEKYVQQTLSAYQHLSLQDIERAGDIEVGGAQGALLRLTTYVDAQGQTVATPPVPDAKPQSLVQALYTSGDQSFTFSITWPSADQTDYLTLFRAILRTFTLAGAS
ncbi:MAG: hypothetical protein ACR2PL_26685 [Dehalococcoidia bacterium]